jgi:hypothetical protein
MADGSRAIAPGTLGWTGFFAAAGLALASAGCTSGGSGSERETPSLGRVESSFSCTGPNCNCGPTFGIGLVQGTHGNGSIHNFELVMPHSGGGFSHYFRENAVISNVDGQTWKGPTKFGSDPDVAGVMALEHSVNGNLEVIATIGDRLVHFWRNRSTLVWSSGTTIATGVSGQPGFVQSTSTTTPNNNRNFEVVVPLASGGLAHYWRNHTNSSLPWVGPTVFATGRVYQAASLVESNFAPNRLEVVARSGQSLYFTWRTNDWQWQTPVVVSADGTPVAATGVHQFIQGNAGTRGNFELVVPAPGGGLQHYYRNNDDVSGGYPWHYVGAVDPINTYTSAAAMWSEYDNLEVVGRRSNNGALAAFFYDNGWQVHGQNSSGETAWAGQVFGGEPCCDPATKGVWSDPINSGAIGIHAALLHTGKVLFFGFQNDENMGYSEIFDPAAPNSPEAPGGDQPHAFCSGHAFLSDGDLWVSGGHGDDHVKGSHVFDPDTQLWDMKPDMPNGRWYPTLTRLANGSVLAISGSSESGPLQASNPVNSTWQTMGLGPSFTLGAEQAVPNPYSAADGRAIELYPFQYLLPNGNIFVHSRRTSRFFTPSTNTWSLTQYITQYPYGRTYPGNGTSVLLPLSANDYYRARILVLGGSGDIVGGTDDASKLADSTIPATDTVEELDLGASTVQWRNREPMTFARVLHTATLLPDGKVFVSGGSYVGRSDNGNAPVQTPELYDPATDSWTLLCAMRFARLYHSTALLLPDARVLTAGRDHAFNARPYNWPERRIEIFTPPYLLNGQPRPVLGTVPTNPVAYDANFNVTVTNAVTPSNINRAVLMSPGAVTHGFDMGQRAIELQIVSQSNTTGTLTLRSPPDGNVAPPGYYMLFLLSNQGVPSVAKFIRL